MASYTENYNLTKPDEADYYDIAEFNANMDAIDCCIAETAAEVAGVSEKIGKAEDTGTETIFGKLNQMASGSGTGLPAIKSIQTFHCNSPTTFALQTVVPQNCIVYINRLQDISGSGGGTVTYSLKESELQVTNMTYLQAEFWIIEFC